MDACAKSCGAFHLRCQHEAAHAGQRRQGAARTGLNGKHLLERAQREQRECRLKHPRGRVLRAVDLTCILYGLNYSRRREDQEDMLDIDLGIRLLRVCRV